MVAALADRPVAAHDAKALGTVPDPLGHDTMLGAYLLEPARRGFPLRELSEERGFLVSVDDEAAADALRVQALTAWQRERAQGARPRPTCSTRSSCRSSGSCASMEQIGVRLDAERLAEIQRARARRGRDARARDLGASPARSS